jgi:4-hydroxybenzoyl-CoA thioesterase
MSVRVEWGDCDPARIIFYPRYFAWVDAAGHHMMESAGLHQDLLVEKYGIRGTVLGNVAMSFKSPGFFGDTLAITTSVTRVGNRSFKLAHEIHRDKELLLTGEETRIWALEDPDSPSGISAGPIPDEVKRLLSA